MTKKIKQIYLVLLLFFIIVLFQNCESTGFVALTKSSESPNERVEDLQPYIYVSLEGSDLAAGTIAAPLRTPAEALKRYRNLRERLSTDFHIFIRGGTYELNSALIITEAESGPQGGARLIIQSYAGEKVVFSGGTAFKDFKEHIRTDKGSIQYRNIPANLNFRQIYVDDSSLRPHRARFPNLNKYLISDRREFISDGSELRSHILPHFELDKRVFDGSELVILESHRQTRYPVKKVQSDSNSQGITVTATEKVSRDKFKLMASDGTIEELGAHFRAYFENAYNFVDVPTEWFYSANDGQLFYMTSEKIFTGTIVVPRLENILKIKGASNKLVERVTIEGIELRHTTWNSPSWNGYAAIQTGIHFSNSIDTGFGAQVPGGFTLENAREIVVRKSRISDMGGAGLVLKKGLKDIVIEENLITNISGNGIASQNMCRFPDRNNDEKIFSDCFGSAPVENITSDIRISGNIIQRISQDFEGAGIFFPRGKNIQILNNTLQFLPYAGIAVGFWYQRDIDAFSNFIINGNEIRNSMLLYDDGGAIYLNGENTSCEESRQGISISQNFIYENIRRVDLNAAGNQIHATSRGPTIGIYLDGGACKALVVANYFEHVTTAFLIQSSYSESTTLPKVITDLRAKYNTIYDNQFSYLGLAMNPIQQQIDETKEAWLDRIDHLFSINSIGDPIDKVTGNFLGSYYVSTPDFLKLVGAQSELKETWKNDIKRTDSDPSIYSEILTEK